MNLHNQDENLLTGMKRCTANARGVELFGTSSRVRDLAVELLQSSLSVYEQAVNRSEFEGIEANEHYQTYKGAHDAVVEALERLVREMQSAGQGGDVAALRQFIEEHPHAELDNETGNRLEKSVRETKALAQRILGAGGDDPRVSSLDGAFNAFRQAQVDYERESGESIDARNKLAAVRQDAFVAVLNARDIMRAALRSSDRLEELDGIIPTLGDILNPS